MNSLLELDTRYLLALLDEQVIDLSSPHDLHGFVNQFRRAFRTFASSAAVDEVGNRYGELSAESPPGIEREKGLAGTYFQILEPEDIFHQITPAGRVIDRFSR